MKGLVHKFWEGGGLRFQKDTDTCAVPLPRRTAAGKAGAYLTLFSSKLSSIFNYGAPFQMRQKVYRLFLGVYDIKYVIFRAASIFEIDKTLPRNNWITEIH